MITDTFIAAKLLELEIPSVYRHDQFRGDTYSLIAFYVLFLFIDQLSISWKNYLTVGDHLLNSCVVNVWFRGDIVRRNQILVTLRG